MTPVHITTKALATHIANVHGLMVEGDESRADLIEGHDWLHANDEEEANGPA